MNTKLRTEAKNDFEKDFFQLMNAVFGKTMGNIRKHRNIKLVTTEEIIYLQNLKLFRTCDGNRMKKTKLKMNKPIYLSLSILDISKTFMYEFWYDYITKYQDSKIMLHGY